MVKQALIVALIKSALQVLDHLGPLGGHRRRRQRPRPQGHGRTDHRRPEPGVTLGRDHHAKHRSKSLTLGLGL
jgi:hypothetical protein